jgi:hypothetical protein
MVVPIRHKSETTNNGRRARDGLDAIDGVWRADLADMAKRLGEQCRLMSVNFFEFRPEALRCQRFMWR